MRARWLSVGSWIGCRLCWRDLAGICPLRHVGVDDYEEREKLVSARHECRRCLPLSKVGAAKTKTQRICRWLTRRASGPVESAARGQVSWRAQRRARRSEQTFDY